MQHEHTWWGQGNIWSNFNTDQFDAHFSIHLSAHVIWNKNAFPKESVAGKAIQRSLSPYLQSTTLSPDSMQSAQEKVCTCSSESVPVLIATESVHALIWKCAHAQLKVCTCSTGSMHMLKWNHAHAQLKACTCSNKSLRRLKWNWKCAHAQMQMLTRSSKHVHGKMEIQNTQMKEWLASQKSLSAYLERTTLSVWFPDSMILSICPKSGYIFQCSWKVRKVHTYSTKKLYMYSIASVCMLKCQYADAQYVTQKNICCLSILYIPLMLGFSLTKCCQFPQQNEPQNPHK